MVGQVGSAITSDNNQLSKPIIDDFQGAGECVSQVQSLQSIAPGSAFPESVSQYLSASIADSTRRAYRADLADFVRWGGSIPCSPEMIAAYLADRADNLSPITLARRLVAIGRAHASQQLTDPTKADIVRTVLRGIRRTHGVAQRQVSPVLREDLLSMLPMMTGTKGLRDRALILLGFAAALRRSELVALDYTDLAFVSEGLILHIRKSKTDQEGEGRKIGVPYGRSTACPVKAVQLWLEHAQIGSGPIMRSVKKSGAFGGRLSAHAVAQVVKSYAKAIGLDADNVSGHSLRAGLATSAAKAGIAMHKIQQQTGHKGLEMLTRYIRDGELFINNAGGIL
jgi:site-specific recombinase XerD